MDTVPVFYNFQLCLFFGSLKRLFQIIAKFIPTTGAAVIISHTLILLKACSPVLRVFLKAAYN